MELKELNDVIGIYKEFEDEYRSAISYIQKKVDTNKSIIFKLFYKISIEDDEPIVFEEVSL